MEMISTFPIVSKSFYIHVMQSVRIEKEVSSRFKCLEPSHGSGSAAAVAALLTR